MDPLSGVASVIAIIGAANVVLKSIDRLRSVLGAPEAVDALVDEVQALQALLRDAKEAQGLLKQANFSLYQLERQAELKLKELDEIINNRLMKGSRNGHTRSKHIRLRWLRSQSKVRALLAHLRSINSNLTTSLTTIIVSGQLHLQTSVQEVALVADQISADEFRLNSAICTRLDLQDDHLSQLSKQILQMKANTENQHSTGARVEQLPGSLISSKKQADNAGIRHHTASGLESAIEVRNSSKNPNQCSGACICRCHPKRRIWKTEVLSSLAGSMCVSYIGGQMSRPCDQSSCRKKLPATLNLTYYFPRWLLSQLVSILMSFDPAGSPKMSMQMPRIRPDASKIFHLATAGNIGGMMTMFERGLASPNDVSYTFGYSVLHFAVDLEHIETIRFLLSQGANPGLTNRLNLTAADLAWNRILSKRTDRSKRYGLSSLFGMTSQADQIESRRLTRLQQIILGLLNEDFDFVLKDASASEIDAKDADGNTVLSWSARCANEHATRSLLERGAAHYPFSRFGSTALHYAAGAWSPSGILPLLKAGADANTRNACLHETPLHVAALRHDKPEDFLAPLISHGADVNACDHEGSSVLAFAAQANHCRSAKYLLDHGADINGPDESGLTPIGVAVIYNHRAMFEMFLKHGARAAHTMKAEETLLHLCALHGDLATLNVLANANLELLGDTFDAQGQRASDYARLRGDEFARAFDGLITTLKPPVGLTE